MIYLRVINTSLEEHVRNAQRSGIFPRDFPVGYFSVGSIIRLSEHNTTLNDNGDVSTTYCGEDLDLFHWEVRRLSPLETLAMEAE